MSRSRSAAGLALALGLAACGGGGGGNGPGSKPLDLVIGNALPLSGTSKALGASGEKASQLALGQIKQAIGRGRLRPHGPDPQPGSGRGLERRGGRRQDARQRPGRELPDRPLVARCRRPDRQGHRHPVQDAGDLAGAGRRRRRRSQRPRPDRQHRPAGVAARDRPSPRRSAGRWAAQQGHTVNVAASNDTYGDTITQDFIEAWQGQDGTVGGQVVLAAPPLTAPRRSVSGSSAYSAQASQITSGNPDAILLIDDLNGFSQLAPALSSSGSWDAAHRLGQRPAGQPGSARRWSARTPSTGCAPWPRARREDEAASSAFVQAFESARPAHRQARPVRRAGVRRHRALLSRGGRGRLDGRPEDGRRADRHHRAGRGRVQLAAAPRGDQGARGRQGHRLHGRLRPDRHGRPRQSHRRRLRRLPVHTGPRGGRRGLGLEAEPGRDSR